MFFAISHLLSSQRLIDAICRLNALLDTPSSFTVAQVLVLPSQHLPDIVCVESMHIKYSVAYFLNSYFYQCVPK